MPVFLLAIDHVALAMPAGEESEARRFYCDLLGLTEVEKPPALATRGGCWFQTGGVMIHLGVERDFNPARKGHPCFIVADLQVLQRRLEAAGTSVTSDAVVEGANRFYASDPFGNRIEFIQDGQGFSQT